MDNRASHMAKRQRVESKYPEPASHASQPASESKTTTRQLADAMGDVVMQVYTPQAPGDRKAKEATAARVLGLMDRMTDALLAPILFGFLESMDRLRFRKTSKSMAARMLERRGAWTETTWGPLELEVFALQPTAHAYQAMDRLHPPLAKLKKLTLRTTHEAVGEDLFVANSPLAVVRQNITNLTVLDIQFRFRLGEPWPNLRHLRLALGPDDNKFHQPDSDDLMLMLMLLPDPKAKSEDTLMQTLRVDTWTKCLTPRQYIELWDLNAKNAEWGLRASKERWRALTTLGLSVHMNTEAWTLLATSCPALTKLVLTDAEMTPAEGKQMPTVVVDDALFRLWAKTWPEMRHFSWRFLRSTTQDQWRVTSAGWLELKAWRKLHVLRIVYSWLADVKPTDMKQAFPEPPMTEDAMIECVQAWPAMERLILTAGLPLSTRILEALNQSCRHLTRVHLHAWRWGYGVVPLNESIRLQDDPIRDIMTFVRAHPALHEIPMDAILCDRYRFDIADPYLDDEKLTTVAMTLRELKTIQGAYVQVIHTVSETTLALLFQNCWRLHRVDLRAGHVTDALFKALVAKPPDPRPAFWLPPTRPLYSLTLEMTRCNVTDASLGAIASSCPKLHDLELSLDTEDDVATTSRCDVHVPAITRLLAWCPRLEYLWIHQDLPLHEPVFAPDVRMLVSVRRREETCNVKFAFRTWDERHALDGAKLEQTQVVKRWPKAPVLFFERNVGEPVEAT